jgi:hypothetical protein
MLEQDAALERSQCDVAALEVLQWQVLQRIVLCSGKLVLLGGQGPREGTAKEVCHLDLQSMTWEKPMSARMHWQTVQASCTIMSSSKVRKAKA